MLWVLLLTDILHCLLGLPMHIPRRVFASVTRIVMMMVTFACQTAQAIDYRVLHSFSGSDGSNPEADLILDSVGTLYGTARSGGAFNAGVIFKMTRRGKETVLYTFSGGTDGGSPRCALLRNETTGDMYGTAVAGGSSGDGVIFKLNRRGKYVVLHSFTGDDGRAPQGALIQDSLGNIYGVACNGGAGDNGVVFSLAAGGEFRVLHRFSGSDGAAPMAGLEQDGAENLYGITAYGSNGYGTVFKLALDGTLTTLHTFSGASDGANPLGRLYLDKKSNLYGTTSFGGDYGTGTVFKLAPNGRFSTLYAFADGGNPYAGLIRINDVFYGTTPDGGDVGYGSVFSLTKAGAATTLHSFAGPPADGDTVYAGLARGKRGILYGTTVSGGSNGMGVIFSVRE